MVNSAVASAPVNGHVLYEVTLLYAVNNLLAVLVHHVAKDRVVAVEPCRRNVGNEELWALKRAIDANEEKEAFRQDMMQMPIWMKKILMPLL